MRMKKVLLVLITVFALFISADAAELKISNENGNGKVTAVKVNDETVKISASVRLLNEKEPVKLKFVTVALYGPTKPDNYYYETTIESVPYYSYYIDQLRTDENGVVNLNFTVSVKNIENCYLMLGGYNVSDKYEMVISLPPAEPQEVKPMDKPSSSGGGGGSGVSPSIPTPVTPVQPSDDKTPEFRDVPATHWAYNDFVKLSRLGIITGDGDGNMRPDDNISREEIAAVLSRAFKFTCDNEAFYIDGTTSDWARKYIAAAVENGIMLSDENGVYRGKENALRAEVAAMINRHLKLSGNEESIKGFNDFSLIPDYSIGAFAALADNGIIGGYEDNTLRPNDYITRAELFKIVSKVSELK